MARRGHPFPATAKLLAKPDRGLDPVSARLLERFAAGTPRAAQDFDYVDVIGDLRMPNLYMEQLQKAGLVSRFSVKMKDNRTLDYYVITASGKAYLELLK